MKIKNTLFVLFTTICFLNSSCRTVPPNEYQVRSGDMVVSNAFNNYVKLNADGTDINAMLSYYTLGLYTSNKRSWKEYRLAANDYLDAAVKTGISSNYTITAGTNEVYVVSNFLYQAILLFEQNDVPASSGSSDISAISQSLMGKIQRSEYDKNE
jgi:hypothetical protein